jgi:hypothetical protein
MPKNISGTHINEKYAAYLNPPLLLGLNISEAKANNGTTKLLASQG